jgi:glycosyltransferase involved in cell wall biosynthesis
MRDDEVAPAHAAAPAVSVVIPARNAARYLPAALESLAAQTFRDFEIIAVDNGSTDETAEILQRWTEREPRLRVLSLARPGLAAALNHGIAAARAPLIARLDADDVALPERLMRQARAFAEQPELGLLGSAVDLIDRRGRKIGERHRPLSDEALRRFQRGGSGFVQSSVMFRREAYDRAGGYRRGLNCAEDYDLWLRISEVAGIANLPEILVRYRIHHASMSARLTLRLALTATCVRAAQEARLRGEPEPFVGGVPKLRRAHALLGMPPEPSRRALRLHARRDRFHLCYLSFPLPAGLKAALRRSAVAGAAAPRWLPRKADLGCGQRRRLHA